MENALNLDQKNMATVMLTQALCGAISSNFRMVAISFASEGWIVLFVLEKESSDDREEIEDFEGEFDALLMSMDEKAPPFSVEIEVSQAPIPRLDPAIWSVVFRRKESHSGNAQAR